MSRKGLRELVRDYERMLLMRTLTANHGDRNKTAEALKMTRRALDMALLRHRIGKPRFARRLPIRPRPDDERSA